MRIYTYRVTHSTYPTLDSYIVLPGVYGADISGIPDKVVKVVAFILDDFRGISEKIKLDCGKWGWYT